MAERWVQLVAVIACLGGFAAGCQQAPQERARHSVRQPASMVFAAPDIRPGADADLPWFAQRNDARLTTYSGYETPRQEVTTTWVYERQYQHGRFVRDHLNVTTYRSSIKGATR